MALVEKEIEQTQLRDLVRDVQAATLRLSSEPNASADAIETTANSVVALLDATPTFRDPALERDAVRNAEAAVRAIRERGGDNPVRAPALLRIATVASERDAPHVAAESLEALVDDPGALAGTGEDVRHNLRAISAHAAATENPRLEAYAEHAEALSIVEHAKAAPDPGAVDPEALRQAREGATRAKMKYESLADGSRATRAGAIEREVNRMLSDGRRRNVAAERATRR
jgi:hypothetical protein